MDSDKIKAQKENDPLEEFYADAYKCTKTAQVGTAKAKDECPDFRFMPYELTYAHHQYWLTAVMHEVPIVRQWSIWRGF